MTTLSEVSSARPEQKPSLLVLVLCLLALFSLVLVSLFSAWRLFTWGSLLALFAVGMLGIGKVSIGRWCGLLIDERNKISLSRLQMTVWTLLILSAFCAAALHNLLVGPALNDALRITFPVELWLVMGISVTTLLGTPLIHNVKARQQTLQPVETPEAINRGRVLVNKQSQFARWTDLFKGEEVSNSACVDLGKVQMFYFTIILFGVYGFALALLFMGNAPLITAFPPVSDSMIGLIGISHAGYLVNKALPRGEA